MMICEHCLEAIRSRGEKVFDTPTYESGTCEWCDEEDDNLYEVEFI